MAHIPFRNKNIARVGPMIMLQVCSEEFKQLKFEYRACETVEGRKEKNKGRKEVISKIIALLARVSKLGEPGNKLKKEIESFLKGDDIPNSLVGKLILEREGVSIISIQPFRNPKNKRAGNKSLLKKINEREIQNIPLPHPAQGPPSPISKLSEDLKASTNAPPQGKGGRFRIK